jgi:predicted DCC family thiol-disulfide oxidoreductase YuxK
VRLALARDRGRRFRFAPLQGTTYARLVAPERRASLPDSLVVLDSGGELYVRAAAVARVLQELGGTWRVLARILRSLPRPVADGAYALVARARRRLFRAPPDLCPKAPADAAGLFDP